MKRAYLSFVLWGNMAYDRYDRHEMKRLCVDPYRRALKYLADHPRFHGHVCLSGMTFVLLHRYAADVIETLDTLSQRGQIGIVAGYYAAPHGTCIDGPSAEAQIEIGANLVRACFDRVEGFFAQENVYHPQMPGLIDRAGLSWLFLGAQHSIERPFHVVGLDQTVLPAVPLVTWEHRCPDCLPSPDAFYIAIADFEQIGRAHV